MQFDHLVMGPPSESGGVGEDFTDKPALGIEAEVVDLENLGPESSS